MARQKGTANFSGTLEPLASGPIDARTVVPTLADLTVASNFPYAYVGLETYVTAENKKYRLINADVTQLSNWEEIGAGNTPAAEVLTGVLTAASWSENTQTVSIEGITTDIVGTVGLLQTATAEQVAAAKAAGIVATSVSDGSISFRCDEAPSIDIPFGIAMAGTGLVGGSGGGASNSYYDQETAIGYWVDGTTPVYTKTFSGVIMGGSASSNGEFKTLVDLSEVGCNVGTLISMEGFYNFKYPLNFAEKSDDNTKVNILATKFNRNNKTIEYLNEVDNLVMYTITIKYMKPSS